MALVGSQMNSGRRKNRKSWQTAKMTEIVWHHYEEDYIEQDPETEVTPDREEKLDTFGKVGEQEPLAANRDHNNGLQAYYVNSDHVSETEGTLNSNGKPRKQYSTQDDASGTPKPGHKGPKAENSTMITQHMLV